MPFKKQRMGLGQALFAGYQNKSLLPEVFVLVMLAQTSAKIPV